ncbi:MAG: translation initiation factor IF-2 [Calditrichaeota bacterium]|nr:translation initiation factor IF-2 [Calditrichota bacterium]
MTTKKKRKLFQVAKELNLSSGTIKEFLEKKGYTVKGLNMIITDEVYDEILQRFAHEKKAAEKLQKRRMEKKLEEQKAASVERAAEAAAEVTPRETAETPTAPTEASPEPVEEIKPEETAPAESPEAPVEEPVETTVEAVPQPEEVTPEAPPAETAEEGEEPAAEAEAAVETPETEEKAEETPAEAREEPKPKVGDIVDHPMAREYLKRLEEEEREKRERQRRILKRIREEGKKARPADLIEKAAAEERAEPKLTPEQLEEKTLEEERKKERKKGKKKTKKELEDEREARRRKAFEMIRKEGKKFKRDLRAIEEEEEGEEVVKPAKEGRKKRGKKKKEVDQKEVEETLRKTLAEMRDAGTGRKKRKKVKDRDEEEIEENVIKVTEFITTQDLANLMDVPASEIIRKCLELGLIVTINQRLDMDTIKLLAEEFGYKVEEEEEFAAEILEEESEEDRPEDLQPRPPVVTIMGHVDHGKTSLLDYIRNTNVVAGEAGGITQHIGAYEVELEDGRKITFLDTPGHEAFTAMRARGAQVTDIVVLVIAADDRVMPQTEEAIDHARAAGVPIVIAINKIDKPNADPQAIRKQLAERNILVEDWGGTYQVVEVSAKTGQGVDELLEKILLEAELLELKANPNKKARGVVLEAKLDKGKGPVATVLIQEGTLRVGDYFVVGQHWGRVRSLLNERGQRVESAGPSTPVQVLGIDGVPEAGDRFVVMEDEKKVKEIAQRRQQLKREQDFRKTRTMTLDEFSRQIREGAVKKLNIMVKADVDGSAQALADALLQLSQDEVAVEVIRRAVGPISESDVLLAAASNAIIIGFHVRPTPKAKELAEQEHVDIRLYKVIYDAIEDVKKALEGMLEPEEREILLGTAEVRETFKISRLGTVAGCYVLNGKITRNSNVRLIRNDVEIYDGKLASLKRFKEDVREVQAGYECGMMLENFNDIKVGDIIEAYEIVKEARTLDQVSKTN